MVVEERELVLGQEYDADDVDDVDDAEEENVVVAYAVVAVDSIMIRAFHYWENSVVYSLSAPSSPSSLNVGDHRLSFDI